MSLSKKPKVKADNRRTNWNYEEMMTLINIWRDKSIQRELKKWRRNAPIDEKVAKKMVEAGYKRNYASALVKC